MNLFLVDYTAKSIARQLVDKHVLAGINEVSQLLCTAHALRNHAPYLAPPYKPTHLNHPTTNWVAKNCNNYMWTVSFGYELAKEYTHRWGKQHKSQAVIHWCDEHIPNLWTWDKQKPLGTWFDLDPPIVTKDWHWQPNDWNAADVRYMYRCYYLIQKSHLFKWTKRQRPQWIDEKCPACGRWNAQYPFVEPCGWCQYTLLSAP